MLTVSALARQCGLSRSTLLYYESIGLLRRPSRTAGNYRAYTKHDLARLRQIGVYRKVGLSLAAIRTVLDLPGGGAAAILERRLVDIDAEIETLRGHQRAILCLLQRSRAFRRTKMITKDKWVAIMRGAGFTEPDMHRWHREFERTVPQEHQEFLEFLHIPADEIKSIREWSRAGKHP
jgi:MerR family transcriptional regulator, thiopeptide resistance regulator